MIRIKRTLFCNILTISCLLALISCGRSNDIPRSTGSQQPCDYQSLLGDFGWNAAFVYRFVGCLRQSNDPEQPALPATAKSLDRLGPEALQAGLDLLKSPSEPEAALADQGLPYLRALSTMIDRASYDFSDRLLLANSFSSDTIQLFLTTVRPATLLELLLAWHQQGQLQDNLLAVIDWLDALPPATLSATTRRVLQDPTLWNALQRLSQEWLESETLVESWTSLLGTEPATMPDRSCWFERRSGGICPEKSTASHPWLAFMDYWNQLDTATKERSLTNLALLIQEWMAQDELELAAQIKEILAIARAYVAGQASASEDLLAWIGPLMISKLDSFKPFMDGLRAIRNNPLYFDVIQEKVALSNLKGQIEHVLTGEGGQTSLNLKACPGLDLPPIGADQSPEQRHRLWGLWTDIHPACQGLRPIQALMLETLDLPCDASCQERLKTLANRVLSADADSTQLTELNQRQLQFINYAIEQLAVRLEASPAYLYGLGLANHALTQAQQTTLIDQLRAATLSNLNQIADLEQTLSNDQQWRLSLHAGFFTRWLLLQLDELQLVQHQISSFLPPTESEASTSTWYKTARDDDLAHLTLVGLFPGSRQSQWLLKRVQANAEAASLDLLSQPSLQRYLAVLQSPLALFRNRNFSFKAEPVELAAPWRGRIRNHVRFDEKGLLIPSNESGHLADLMVGTNTSTSLYLPHRWLDTMAIAEPALSNTYQRDSIWNSREQLAKTFLPSPTAWVGDWLNPDFIGATDQHLSQIQFFTGRGLANSERHLIWWFLLQNFADPNSIPISPEAVLDDLAGRQSLNGERVARLLGGAQAFGSEKDVWYSHLAHHSSFLQAASKAESFQDFLNAITPSKSQMLSYYDLLRTEPRRFQPEIFRPEQLEQLTDIERLFGSLNLNSYLYRSRSEAVLSPLAAFSEVCPRIADGSEQFSTERCPIQFSSYEEWRRWFQQQISNKYCPLIDLKEFDAVQIANSFGWKNTDGLAALFASCTNTYQSTQETTALSRFSLSLLANLGNVGRPQSLHADLSSLYQELSHQNRQAQDHSKDAILNTLWRQPIQGDGNILRMAKLQEDFYRPFSTQATDQFGLYLLELKQALGSRQVLTALLNYLQREGGLQRLEDFIDASLEQFELAFLSDANLLEFAYLWSKSVLTSDDYRQVVEELLSDLDQPTTGILLSYTLPQALRAGVLPGLQSTAGTANSSAYRWMFATLAPQRWQLMSSLVQLAQPKLPEVIDVINLSLRQYQSAAQFSTDILSFLAFFGQQIDYLKTEKQLDPHLRTMLSLGFSETFPKDISLLATALLRDERIDIANRKHLPILANARQVVQAALEHLPSTVNQLFSGEGLPEAKTLTNSVASFTRALNTGSGPQVFRLLQDRRLGFWDGAIWENLIRKPQNFQRLNTLLSGFHSLQRQDLLDVIAELDEIALASNRWLAFINRRVIWSENQSYATDYAYALASLDRCLNLEHRWQFTKNLMEVWIIEDP